MSLLFGSTKPHLVSVHYSEDIHSDGDVHLDQKLWNIIAPGNSTAGGRIAVTLQPALVSGLQPDASSIQSIICWARLDSRLNGVRVPRRWIRTYPSLFPQRPHDAAHAEAPNPTSHKLSMVQPVVLTEIVLLAHSHSALEIARSKPQLLEEWFNKEPMFVRNGATYHFNSPSMVNGVNGNNNSSSESVVSRYEYSVAMTEPVLQGITKLDHTRFVVTSGNFASQDSNSTSSESPRTSASDLTDESEISSDVDAIEINEDFLGNSIASPLTHSRIQGSDGPKEDWGNDSPDTNSPPSGEVLNGNDLSNSEESQPTLMTFSPRPFSYPAPSKPSGRKGDDPEARVYLNPADMGKIGIFSGDWAIVSKSAGSNTRLARAIAHDKTSISTGRSSLMASPVFLHNLGAGSAPLVVRPSPFGSRLPSLPTARSVTVARVASPHASDRAYQPIFLRALKRYFETNMRLVKMGDLVAVGIHIEGARILDDQGDSDTNDDNTTDTTAFLDYEFPLSSSATSGVVFFKITNIEHDVLDIAQTTPGPDAYFAATMGELGCWVDPKVTQMMQTGLEHSRVPDVISYLSVDPGYVPYPAGLTPSPSTPFGKLLSFVSASLLPTAVDYDLYLSVLLKGARGIGKQTTSRWVAQKLGVHLLEINCFDVVGDSDAKTEGTLRARVERAADCSPCILMLRHIEALARNTQTLETGKEPAMATILQDCLSDLRKTWKLTGYPVLVFGTSSEPEKIPQGVLSCFKHEISFEAPAEAERLEILNRLLQQSSLAPDVVIKSIATQTAALVAGDLVDLVRRVKMASVKRTLSASPSTSENDCISGGLVLTGSDFDVALGDARASYSESIGAPKIPNVTWDDVGGLANVKQDILDTIQLPLDYPELFADGLKKRSGILLYGPPGTGKTLLAKAVATSCSLNFFSVKGPELLNMYIGESEANVRRVFQRARDAKPCVIFFDELDSIAPKRGNHGDSGGVMDRIVSQLLAELDGMADGKGGADVFVIGATNRPDLLDSALLRPGRFDRMLYLGVSDTHEAQLNIMRALTRNFRLDPELDLNDIAQQCPFNYTGADFYALCSDAMLKSMSRKAQEIDDKIVKLNAMPPPYTHPHPLTPQYYLAEMATPTETDVLVSRKDFELALHELVPSVSQGEMEHYAQVQRKFANDTINAIKVDSEVQSHGVVQPSGSSMSSDTLDVAPLSTRVDKGKGKALE